MAFIDELTLHMKAGRGGHGIVSWLHVKGKEFSGPAGGDGGNGGDVYIRGVRDLSKLVDYKNTPLIEAENGGSGKSHSRHGANGKDIYFEVPVGTVVTNTDTGEVYEIITEGQEELILKGGKGGFGNEHFKGSRNVTPLQFTRGTIGEEGDIHIELRLIADFGLVGFPNAGKSSLLNSLTRAKSKIGSYKFTTLEPHLGSMYGHIIADIPGIIEGASENKGLGHKFLRHIRRTKVLLHCLPADSEDYKTEYATIRSELEKYDPGMAKKPEILLITKVDMVDDERIHEMVEYFKKKVEKIEVVSILDDDSVKALSDSLVKFIRDLKESEKSKEE